MQIMENESVNEIRFFLSSRRHSISELSEFLSDMPSNVKVLLPSKDVPSDDLLELANNHPVLELVDTGQGGEGRSAQLNLEIFESILEGLFTDPSTPLIWERSKTSARLEFDALILGNKPSFLKGSAEISRSIVEFMRFFERTRPSFLLFGATPHTIMSWVRMKVAQQMGIPIYIVNRCAVDGFFRISRRLGREEQDLDIGPLHEEQHHRFRNGLSDIVQRTLAEYADAQPDYERQRFEKASGKFVRASDLIARNWYAPSRAVNSVRSWRALQRSSRGLDEFSGHRFAVFFLHYQPEATSVPDGDLFGVQINAILAMRSALPEGVHLLVKEHPASFMLGCHAIARDPAFYAQIAALTGVDFVDIRTDNFQLVDRAALIGTITGTVGREAQIRGKPTVFFGKSFIPSSPWCFNWQQQRGFEAFVTKVTASTPDREEVRAAFIENVEGQASNAFYSDRKFENTLTLDGLKAVLRTEQPAWTG
jgi:hypothetical protein